MMMSGKAMLRPKKLGGAAHGPQQYQTAKGPDGNAVALQSPRAVSACTGCAPRPSLPRCCVVREIRVVGT